MNITPRIQPHNARPYRADIDGLRAVAVLLVVFDHLQFRPFSGGYIGVDVFFVISGYLIGSSLIADFREGRFTLRGFYERRIRRIVPALLAMLAIVSGLAYAYLTPRELVQYGQSIGATVFSASNVYFWSQSGYFDLSSSTLPLLHTWSLAVEEQFYLVFPLLLFAIFRLAPRQLRVLLWSLSAITLVASVIVVSHFDPGTAFYWAPLRAWELLLGVIISQYPLRFLHLRWTRECCSLLGLVLIMGAGIHYTSWTPFPGWAALIPCLGAAAIIASGQCGSSVTGRFLSLPPITFVGLISYSLYLWHWPLLVFQSMGFIISSGPSGERRIKLTILIISLIAATISWRFIELPFRQGRFKPGKRTLFLSTGAIAAMLLVFAALTIVGHGLPARLPKDVQQLASFESYDVSDAWRVRSCFLLTDDSFDRFTPSSCLSQDLTNKRYLLFGDSIAAQLMSGLSSSFPEIQFQQATAGRCAPIAVQPLHDARITDRCKDMWTYIHNVYLASQHPNAVILAADWTADELPELGAEIRRWQQLHIQVILLGPVLEFDSPLPALLASQLRQRNSEEVRRKVLSRHFWSPVDLDRTMREKAEKDWHVRYISYFDVLCLNRNPVDFDLHWTTYSGCPTLTSGGVPLLFDQRHLTANASLLFVRLLRDEGQLP